MPWRETPQELARARAEIPSRVMAPDGALFGVYTPASPDAPAAGLCVIHLTRPRAHRNRNWVQAARQLGAAGFSAYRFDYHGTGDSGGASAFLDPSAPYRADVVAVIRHLRERFGERRFVLTGSCFDARTALSAFRDEADAIAGLVFIAAPVMSLDHMRELRDSSKDWRHVVQALNNPDNWRSLTRPERWREMVRVLRGAARHALGDAPTTPVSASAAPAPLDPGFVADFEALARSHARALFLYGEADPEFRTFQPAMRDLWPRLPLEVRKRFEVEVWPGEVHGGFLDMQRQRLILERVLDWVQTCHPGAGSRAVEPTRPAEGAWTSA